MSQHWHGHWTEETFTAKRLRNWEVPKWYPSRPDRHCGATQFITNDNGHILDSTKKAECSPWGTYKSTWDLPKRITRNMAVELSATPQYKKEIWELHKKKHKNLCKKIDQAKKKAIKIRKDTESTDTVKRDETDEIQESIQAQADSDSAQDPDSGQDSDPDPDLGRNTDIRQNPDPGQDPNCISAKMSEED